MKQIIELMWNASVYQILAAVTAFMLISIIIFVIALLIALLISRQMQKNAEKEFAERCRTRFDWSDKHNHLEK